MKLDPRALRYLTADHFRVLTAVEMGMKNHELVPTKLIFIRSISGLGRGLAYKCLKVLHRNKLVFHEAKRYDGYRLTYQGYDYLALNTLRARGVITGIGKRIGVGKEADIFIVQDPDGIVRCLKLHRLGRTSFRQIKRKRDYLKHRSSPSWFYMSRLASVKEYAFMKVLHEHGFPVPMPIDHNRHAVVMELIDAYPIDLTPAYRVQVQNLVNPGAVFSEMMNIIVRLARHGLIHSDFNEFNLMIDDNEKLTLIDFPQMVSTAHADAKEYFDRDVECVCDWFRKKYKFEPTVRPQYEEYVHDRSANLDFEVQASGSISKDEARALEEYFDEHRGQGERVFDEDAEEFSEEDEENDEEDGEDNDSEDGAFDNGGEGDDVEEGDERYLGSEGDAEPRDGESEFVKLGSDDVANGHEYAPLGAMEEEEAGASTASTSASTVGGGVVEEHDPVEMARQILMRNRMENMPGGEDGTAEVPVIGDDHAVISSLKRSRVAVGAVVDEDAEEVDYRKKPAKSSKAKSRKARTRGTRSVATSAMTELEDDEIQRRVRESLAKKQKGSARKVKFTKPKNKVRAKKQKIEHF